MAGFNIFASAALKLSITVLIIWFMIITIDVGYYDLLKLIRAF